MRTYFHPVVSSIFLLLWSPYRIGQTIIFFALWFLLSFFFFSSPNLSGRRLDVCHTSTHGVALESGYIFATKACIDNRKTNLLNSSISPTCPRSMVNFGPLTSEMCSAVWASSKFQSVLRLGSVTARHSSSGRQPNFAALNRGRHLYSAGRPSRWALAYMLVLFITVQLIARVSTRRGRRALTRHGNYHVHTHQQLTLW